MQNRTAIPVLLVGILIGLLAFTVVAQDPTPTYDPAQPTPDPALETPEPTDSGDGQEPTPDPAAAPTDEGEDGIDEQPAVAVAIVGSASLTDADGNAAGWVAFSTQGDAVVITALLSDLPPGFHGVHIHEAGSCEDNEEGRFGAAGGHYNPEGTDHPNHAGDLPTVFVKADGRAFLSLSTDRFTAEELLDGDGSAIIVHANPDNFANIPDRYGAPDADTLADGDSGDAIACGVITEGMTIEMMGAGTRPVVEDTPSGEEGESMTPEPEGEGGEEEALPTEPGEDMTPEPTSTG